MRYSVAGFKKVNREGKIFPEMVEIIDVIEVAKTKEDANLLYDIMLEDETMWGHVQVVDVASGKIVRHSKQDGMDEEL